MGQSGPVVCPVCGDLNAAGDSCERCGSALPKAGSAATQPPKTVPPPPKTKPPQSIPQGSSAPLPQAGTGGGIEQRSARADLEREIAQTMPPAGSAPVLPSAGSSQGIGGGQTYASEVSPFTLPSAGRNDQQFTSSSAPRAKPTQKRRRAPGPVALLPVGFWYILKSGFAIAFLLLLASVAGLLALLQHQAKSPRAQAPRLATRYLTALSATDYASAYLMLSYGAQARCTIDDFRRMRGAGEWTWRNLELLKVEPDAVELSYELSIPGQPDAKLYIFFVKENEHWAVPYNLNLLKEVEKATQSNDPDLALLQSQEAVRVNPRDPMARAYLCEAANFRKFYDQARQECATALKLAEKYPSNLEPKSLEHLRAILDAAEGAK